jgi:hypothetical protein
MHDPKSLEAFFNQYMPAMKAMIESMWGNRQELYDYLQFCLDQGVYSDWVKPYIQDMKYWTKTASHKYTDPWSVL